MDEGLTAILRLQESDRRRRMLERDLRLLPADEKRLDDERRRREEEARARHEAFRALEREAKLLEGAIRDAEERAARLKGQQAMVKKNDEYQALTREIAEAEHAIDATAEQELAVLYRIDAERAALAASDGEDAAWLAAWQERRSALAARRSALESQHAVAARETDDRRGPVPAALLAQYDRLAAAGRFPPLVGLEGHVCQGCHMRVSNNVQQAVAEGKGGVACDQCGRLLH